MRVLRISHSATVGPWRARERALRENGDDVRLLTAQKWHAGGVPVALDTTEEWVLPAATIGTHPALFLYAPRPLWRALGERWDLLDIHEEPFALATAEVRLLSWMRRQRAPYVLYSAQNILKRYPVPFRWLERAALRSASGISACNVEAATITERKGYPGRPQVIPLGVDLSDFAAPTRPAPSADGDIIVGFVGRLVEEKGVQTLLDAAAARPRLRLRFAGAGPLADVLAARADAAGISERVEFVGPVVPEKIAAFYGSLDVLAVPSIPTAEWTEQFGRVAVEAMAAGVPVVSSDAGALPDVVADAGIVVRHGDADALGDALLQAAGPRHAQLRRAGLERAAECSWEAVADDYRSLYASALATATPATDAEPARHPLEIIVVAYGAPALLARALQPLTELSVTVIDNSSQPEIRDLCADLGVRYIDSGANRGFGAAVNIVLRDVVPAGADVLLLNPDAVVSSADIRALHVGLRAEADLASVGPRQIDEQGAQARVRWPFPSPLGSWMDALGTGRLRSDRRGFVIGSVLLLRAEALQQVGGFDERFFLYAEETDWAYRAHLLGWRHGVVDAVTAVHAGAGTSTDSRRRDAMFFASQERYLRKHFGATGWASARLAGWLGAAVRSVLLRGERGADARRRAAIYRLGPVRVERRWRKDA